VNAENDPILPPACYPIHEAKVNDQVYLEIPEMGGHVGFVTFGWNGIYWSESRAEAFFNAEH
ncbi:MAG: alpha/beta hydrolase, partial [Bacteroidota bacterium]